MSHQDSSLQRGQLGFGFPPPSGKIPPYHEASRGKRTPNMTATTAGKCVGSLIPPLSPTAVCGMMPKKRHKNPNYLELLLPQKADMVFFDTNFGLSCSPFRVPPSHQERMAGHSNTDMLPSPYKTIRGRPTKPIDHQQATDLKTACSKLQYQCPEVQPTELKE